MKKILKSSLSFLCILTLVISLFTFTTFAAGSSIGLSKSSVTVGNEVKATITFNPGEAMYAVQGIINYNSSVLEYKSGTASGGAGTLELVESPSGETSISYTLTFKAIAAGSCTISLADCRYATAGANGAEEKALAGSSVNVSVKDVTLSSNANLKSLRLSAGSLSPAFSPSVTTYSVTVENAVTVCKISAVAADSSAKVQVTGSSNLKIGTNTRTVIVTAPNGSQNTYTINITRNEVDENAAKLITDVDGVEHTVATDISSVTMFNGFTASTADYNGVQVGIATDANNIYKIYYLKAADSDVLVPYTYNEETQVFEKIVYFTQGEYSYIVEEFPAELVLPENYYITNAKINDLDLNCYADSNNADFYYLYAFNGEDFGFYRYDVKESNFQRFPELENLKAENDMEKELPDSIWGRFKMLSTNAKVVIILLAAVLLLGFVLIIMLIIRFFVNLIAHKKDKQMDELGFDDVRIDGFDLTDDLDQNNEVIEENSKEDIEAFEENIEE